MSNNSKQQIIRWIAWAERSLASLAISEGLHIGLAQAIQGPMTITFRLRLLQPSKTSLSKLLAMGPTIQQALQVSSVRISGTDRGILIEVPSPYPRTPGASYLARKSRGLQIALGLNSMREPVLLDFQRHPHLLCVGPTRRGKTQALRSLLYAMAGSNTPGMAIFLILAKKGEDWRAFLPSANCLGLLLQPEEQELALAWLAGDLLQRRAEAGQRWPAIFLVADDLINLQARARLSGPLGEIASMGGGAGIHLLISTQTTGKQGGLDQSIEQNMVARLIFGAGDSAAGARYAGQGGLQIESIGIAPGDALLLLDSQPTRLATGLCQDQEIALLPPGELPAPWLLQNSSEQGEQSRTGQNMIQGHSLQGRPAVDRGREGPEQAPEQEEPEQGYLDASRPPTAGERAWLRQLYQETGSKKQAILRAYGHYNGKVFEYVSQALEEPASSKIISLADKTVSQHTGKAASHPEGSQSLQEGPGAPGADQQGSWTVKAAAGGKQHG